MPDFDLEIPSTCDILEYDFPELEEVVNTLQNETIDEVA